MRPGKELKYIYIYIYIHISRRAFFKNQCNEICRLWDDKASKGRFFFKSDKLQIHSNEGKGKEKKKERGGRKEEIRKKTKVALLAFIIATLEKEKCWTQKVHLAETFSKIRLD